MYPAIITIFQLSPLIDLRPWLGIGDFFKIYSVGTLVSASLGTVLVFASLAFLLFLAWAAIRWLTAGGDKNQLVIARDRITHALTGLALIAAAWAIFGLVVYVFSLPIFLQSSGGAGPPTPVPTPPPPLECGCNMNLDPASIQGFEGIPVNLQANVNCSGTGSLRNDQVDYSVSPQIANLNPQTTTSPYQTTVTCTASGTATITADAQLEGCGAAINFVTATASLECTATPPGSCSAPFTCFCECPAGFIPDPAGCVESPFCSGEPCSCIPDTIACTPQQISPPNGAVFPPGDVTVTWNGCPGINWYMVDGFSWGDGWTSGGPDEMVNSTSYTFTGLTADTTVRWNIRNCTGSTFSSCYEPDSGDRQFTIELVDVPIGGACTANGQCTSNFCSNDQDNDSDGYYAAYSSGTGTCRNGPADCRDNRILVHPNQFNYFEVPISGTSDFNYDCADSDGDGDDDDRWPRINCLSSAPQATTCVDTPLPASTYQPQTGWDADPGIPNCGDDLLPVGGPGPLPEFWLCTASHLDNCGASPAVAETFSCSDGCVTGNSCDWGVDQACISWRMDDWLPFSTYLGGITRMPCK